MQKWHIVAFDEYVPAATQAAPVFTAQEHGELQEVVVRALFEAEDVANEDGDRPHVLARKEWVVVQDDGLGGAACKAQKLVEHEPLLSQEGVKVPEERLLAIQRNEFDFADDEKD